MAEYDIGDRVVIVKAEGFPLGSLHKLRDPHPEHLGKCGHITCLEPLMIKLDDGIEVEGCDCWWAKLAER